ncbi:hypothetical protein HanIR_Chr13g0669161 [Helianthus annuus]|nr:hypothetical protein HanIR_Chr13g0669161 [Helianthus annuus]
MRNSIRWMLILSKLRAIVIYSQKIIRTNQVCTLIDRKFGQNTTIWVIWCWSACESLHALRPTSFC